MTSAHSRLEEVRNQINELDEQMVQLIARRQAWVVEAGSLKADEQAVRAPARVEQVIDRVRGLAEQHNASPDVVERCYRALIAAFIDLELNSSGVPVTGDAASHND